MAIKTLSICHVSSCFSKIYLTNTSSVAKLCGRYFITTDDLFYNVNLRFYYFSNNGKYYKQFYEINGCYDSIAILNTDIIYSDQRNVFQ
jgi:phosphoribosylformylglycinamidine (FGAM) synthase-like amidotransferase family enzyme